MSPLWARTLLSAASPRFFGETTGSRALSGAAPRPAASRPCEVAEDHRDGSRHVNTERQADVERARRRRAVRTRSDVGAPTRRHREGEGRRQVQGARPTARARSAEIIALAKEGVTKEKIARRVGVGVASVYRVLRVAASP